MGFLSWLFGKKKTSDSAQGPKSFGEKDNRGTRHDTVSLASSYWMARITSPKKDPFVLYTFDTEDAARDALLDLPCIHVARDSGKLICTEVLIFGCCRTEEGKYEAIVCGDDLTHELWEKAKARFAKHGGRRKNDLEPASRAAVPKAQPARPGKAVFVREDRRQQMGTTMTYRVHKGPDGASAKALLEAHPVNRQFCYIVVETPEGNYCRDIQGMYKE